MHTTSQVPRAFASEQTVSSGLVANSCVGSGLRIKRPASTVEEIARKAATNAASQPCLWKRLQPNMDTLTSSSKYFANVGEISTQYHVLSSSERSE